MSSCLILQDKNNFYIGADTACSTNIDGKFYRYKDDVEKIFTHGDDIYFCAGDMSAVSTIVSWISRDFFGINKIDIDKISVVLREYFPYDCSDIFDIELVVCRKESGTTKIYQLSQYNHYFPIAHMPKENGLNLLCCGYKTQELYDLTYKIISYGCTDSRILYRSVFNAIYDNKVGGSLVLYKNNQPIMCEKIQENNIEYIHKNTNRHHLLIAEAVIAGYIEGSKMVGGTIQIGEYEDSPGTYAFEVDESGNVKMLGGQVEFSANKDSIGSLGESFNTAIGDATSSLQSQINNIGSKQMYDVKIICNGPTSMSYDNDKATLYCKVYAWNTDITEQQDASNFQWHRTSATTNTFKGDGATTEFKLSNLDDKYEFGAVFVNDECYANYEDTDKYKYNTSTKTVTLLADAPNQDSIIEIVSKLDYNWDLAHSGVKKIDITHNQINDIANISCKFNLPEEQKEEEQNGD